MSETPRAETKRVNAFLKKKHVAWDEMWIRFSEQLEREHNETRDRLRFLQNAGAETLSEMPDWSDAEIDKAISLEAAERGMLA